MAKRKQPEGEPGRRPSPESILRWLIRFLIRSVSFGVITLILACLIAWISYVNRTRIVNEVLDRYVEPFEASMESIDLWPLGEVKIKNLTLSPKGTASDSLLASVPDLHLTYDFQQLRDQQRLQSVRIHQPDININQDHIDALTRAQPSEPSGKIDLGAFDLFTEALEIMGGNVIVKLPTFATVQTRLIG